jgi:hypothetical protein
LSSSGTSHLAVVPITPSRTAPITSSRSAARSDASASSSRSMRSVREVTSAPSGVSWLFSRSTSVTPNSRSNRATWADTLDCTVDSDRAAAEKL